MNQLTQSVSIYNTIRGRIIALETDIDEATLADTVEGLTDFHEVVAAVVRSALIEEAMVHGLKGHIQTLQERMDRLAERAATRRQIARDAMLEVDVKKIAAPDFTISIRPGTPGVVVAQEGSIPPAYWVPREPRLDRSTLLTDLKLGLPIACATLSNPEPVLSVRIK